MARGTRSSWGLVPPHCRIICSTRWPTQHISHALQSRWQRAAAPVYAADGCIHGCRLSWDATTRSQRPRRWETWQENQGLCMWQLHMTWMSCKSSALPRRRSQVRCITSNTHFAEDEVRGQCGKRRWRGLQVGLKRQPTLGPPDGCRQVLSAISLSIMRIGKHYSKNIWPAHIQLYSPSTNPACVTVLWCSI